MAGGIFLEASEDGQEAEQDIDIRDAVNKILSLYGLNAPEWNDAISSQYFLVKLARRMGMTHRADFRALYDRFLSSFRFTYDDKLILEPNSVMVTPDETRRMVEAMRLEDESGGPYSSVQRLRSDAIEPQVMHLNYLYALMLEIASAHESQYAKAVRGICISHLSAPECLDPSGGWYPYRTPWLTARVIISLYESGAADIYEDLSNAAAKALSSLVERLSSDGFWASGAGTWVSDVESTALCLEALLVANALDRKNLKIDRVLNFAKLKLEHRDNLLSFESENKANESLALTVLASVVLRVLKQRGKESELREMAHSVIMDVLRLVSRKPNASYRQFCTMPQVLFYAIASVEEDLK